MTHRGTMLSHLATVEQLTAEINDWEQKTRAAVTSKHAATINRLKDPLDQEHVILFHVGQILAKKLVFQRLVSARNRSIELVKMYGIVSLTAQGGQEFSHGPEVAEARPWSNR